MSEEMDRIMGIGPEYPISEDAKKTLRVGTIKQLKETTKLVNDNLMQIKSIVNLFEKDPDKYNEQVEKWVEILNIIFVEGFTKEEFEDSIPEQLSGAVSRFLFD